MRKNQCFHIPGAECTVSGKTTKTAPLNSAPPRIQEVSHQTQKNKIIIKIWHQKKRCFEHPFEGTFLNQCRFFFDMYYRAVEGNTSAKNRPICIAAIHIDTWGLFLRNTWRQYIKGGRLNLAVETRYSSQIRGVAPSLSPAQTNFRKVVGAI